MWLTEGPREIVFLRLFTLGCIFVGILVVAGGFLW